MALFSEAIAATKPQGKNVSKKRFLNQYRYINQEIDRKIQEVSNLRRLLEKITTDYSWTKGCSGNIHGKTEDIVAKIIDLEAEINADIDRLLEAREQIGRMIENVEDPQLRLVLQYRYIDCLPWERIAVEMNYSWKQIHRLHAKALDAIKMTHNDTL